MPLPSMFVFICSLSLLHMVTVMGALTVVADSSDEIPCFRKLGPAFSGSHSILMA